MSHFNLRQCWLRHDCTVGLNPPEIIKLYWGECEGDEVHDNFRNICSKMILTLTNKCWCLKGTQWALRTLPAQCAPPSGKRASRITPGPPACLAFCVWGSESHLCSREDPPSAVHTLCAGQPMLCAASIPGHGTDRHSYCRGIRLPPRAGQYLESQCSRR